MHKGSHDVLAILDAFTVHVNCNVGVFWYRLEYCWINGKFKTTARLFTKV